MAAWFASIFANMIRILTVDLVMWVVGLVSSAVEKIRRAYTQKISSKKEDENIDQKQPRDEQTKKDEDDWINS